MPLYREAIPADAPAVYWWGRPVALVRRMLALADEWERCGGEWIPFAKQLREVLHCDYNPLPDRLPELGAPPTLPMTRVAEVPGEPRKYRPGSSPDMTEPGS